MKHLRIEVGFGVGFDKDHNPIGHPGFHLEAIKQKAVELFGGFTFYNSDGGWRHTDGQLATEPGGTLLIFEEEKSDTRSRARALAEYVKLVLRQESAVLAITSAEFEYV